VSRELIIRPEAESEINEAYDWYEARSRGLGADSVSDLVIPGVTTARLLTQLAARRLIHPGAG
jgi:hypothetical protein